MTLNELRKCQEGDKLICIKKLDNFTKNKVYTIKLTPVGRLIINDNNFGKFIYNLMNNFKVM